jgi:hypothetical protein
MKLSFSRRPSPAVILAVVALAFAMVGTAVAGTDGLSNKITKSKVKKISKKQAKKQLKKNISGSHVNLADNANSADLATTAASVNGVAIEHFFFQAPPGTTDATIGDYGPLTLKATCDGAGNPTLRGSWTKDTNNLRFDGSTASQAGNANTPAGNTISLSATSNFGSVGTNDAQATDKSFETHVEWFTRDAPALGEVQCFFTGYVTVG